MTPALIMNTIEAGQNPDILSCFTLLVFDECHHTYKEHIYNKIMRQYHMEKEGKKKLPQVTKSNCLVLKFAMNFTLHNKGESF
jgi:ERCC4-related helicase